MLTNRISMYQRGVFFLNIMLMTVSLTLMNQSAYAKDKEDDIDKYVIKIVENDFRTLACFCANDKFIHSTNEQIKNKIDKQTCFNRIQNLKLYHAFWILTKNTFTSDELKVLFVILEMNDRITDGLSSKDLLERYRFQFKKEYDYDEFITKIEKLKKQKIALFLMAIAEEEFPPKRFTDSAKKYH